MRFFTSKRTTIEIKRAFKKVGSYYNITMTAKNLHTEGDMVIMVWMVLVAIPIYPNNFDLSYNKLKRPNKHIELEIVVLPEALLPTTPTLMIKRVLSEQRIDQDLVVEENSTVPFQISLKSKPAYDSDWHDSYTIEGMGYGDFMKTGIPSSQPM